MVDTFELKDTRREAAAEDFGFGGLGHGFESLFGVEAEADAFALANLLSMHGAGNSCLLMLTSRPARPARCIADDFVMSLVRRVSKPMCTSEPLLNCPR